MKWWRDKSLWLAVFVGALLRTLPMAIWIDWRCARDECTYIKMAYRLAEGKGIQPSAGWLWAPAYPSLMAIHRDLFGWASTIKGIQVIVALASVFLIYRLAERHFGQRAGRIAAWLYAGSPVMAFFAMSLWSESLYSGLLLLMVLCFDLLRERFTDVGPRRALGWAAATGVVLGACVLFRGVATYMLPVLAFGVVWKRWRRPRAWLQALVLSACAACVVAPYSVHISKKFDAPIIVDRTLGQMMWLGNNDFDPVGFDYGFGKLSRRALNRHISSGRKRCAPMKQAIQRDTCETELGKEWIREHPLEFVKRMPMRVAQMVTPHSLLTRHLRWGYWQGMPQWVDEVIIVVAAAWSMLVMWVGALGICARGRGGRAVAIAGILLYHLAAVSALAGISRYRVPLEPLLMVYAADFLADPRAGLETLRSQKWRIVAAVLVLGALVPLVLWHLPAGWPGWRTW